MRYAIGVPNYGDFADRSDDRAGARHRGGRLGRVPPVGSRARAERERGRRPWSLLAAIAVSTSGSARNDGDAAPPPPPWQVVRQIVTLDHLSGGRAVLGVGIGYPPKQEYEVFGESGDERCVPSC